MVDIGQKVVEIFDILGFPYNHHLSFRHHRKTACRIGHGAHGNVVTIQHRLIESLFFFCQYGFFDHCRYPVDKVRLFPAKKINGFVFFCFYIFSDFVKCHTLLLLGIGVSLFVAKVVKFIEILFPAR